MSRFRCWIALASLALTACGGGSGAAPPPFVVDAWVQPEPSADWSSRGELDAGAVRAVVNYLQPEAQALLAAQSWSVLDAETAARFVQDASLARSPGIPVLVRGVASLPDESSLQASDRFLVRWGGGDLVVSFLAGRRSETAQVRKAIVVMLPEEPRQVFVECLVVRYGGLDK
jgi:hypothetical protein